MKLGGNSFYRFVAADGRLSDDMSRALDSDIAAMLTGKVAKGFTFQHYNYSVGSLRFTLDVFSAQAGERAQVGDDTRKAVQSSFTEQATWSRTEQVYVATPLVSDRPVAEAVTEEVVPASAGPSATPLGQSSQATPTPTPVRSASESVCGQMCFVLVGTVGAAVLLVGSVVAGLLYRRRRRAAALAARAHAATAESSEPTTNPIQHTVWGPQEQQEVVAARA